jgi:hypothetical protein
MSLRYPRCEVCNVPVSSHATHCKQHASARTSVGKTCKGCGVAIQSKHTNCIKCRRPYRKAEMRALQQSHDPMHAGSIAAQMDKIIADELKMPWERQTNGNTARMG